MRGMFRSAGATAVLLAALVAFSPQPASAERERGGPQTPERTLWCNGQLASCLKSGYDDCDTRYPNNADAAYDCYSGVTRACNSSWGGTSTCHSLPRIAPTRPIPIRPRGNVRP